VYCRFAATPDSAHGARGPERGSGRTFTRHAVDGWDERNDNLDPKDGLQFVGYVVVLE
jgi:hypothetical protein